MNGLMLVLRVTHVVCGVYWAGTVFFVAQFLEPVVRGAGPAGGTIMQGLQARKYFAIMPSIAGLTILSGAAMMWIDSSGFNAAWMGSRLGMGLSTGALFAIAGLIVGVRVLRPAGEQMMALPLKRRGLDCGELPFRCACPSRAERPVAAVPERRIRALRAEHTAPRARRIPRASARL
jgi:hypothetical protein